MALQQFFNSLTIPTLTTSILIGDSPAVFEVSGNELPIVPNYTIKIENEILLVTAVDTSGSPYEYTATRAQEGTIAAAHATSVKVTPILTEDSFSLILLQQNEHLTTSNVIDNRVGRVQNIKNKRLVDLGSGYEHYHCPLYKVDPLVDTDYIFLNTDSLANSVVDPSIYKLTRNSPTNDGFALFALPLADLDTPGQFAFAFEILNGAIPGGTLNGISAVGIGVYASSNNKHIISSYGIQNTAPYIFQKTVKYTNFTTVDSTVQAAIAARDVSLMFLRVEYDGTNVTFFYSYNGIDYFQLSQTLQSFLTITHVCIAVSPNCQTHIYHVED